MSNLRQIKDWRAPTTIGAVYERLLAAIGTDQFGPTVRDSVMSVTAGARRIYLFEATDRHNSCLQYFHGEPGLVELFPAYTRWYLRLDPVCDAYRAAPGRSDVAVLRIGPSDIDSPGFRRRFFDDAGIVERISVIQRGVDAWRVINVARHSSDGCCADEELGSLIGLACLVLPMLPLNRQRQSSLPPPTAAQLEKRFANRYSTLTRREREVCARAALGLTVEATARELGIGRTSVLTYRQRAYQRLNVTSPSELCALVMH
ncbi:MAG: helix-turn-helix transcriptional regulator [Gammaproteobacteria bacterium]